MKSSLFIVSISFPLVKVQISSYYHSSLSFPGGSGSKESTCNVRDQGSIPGLGRSPGEENGNPLQYSCLENSTNRGGWWATVHGVTKSWTQLNDSHTHTHTIPLKNIPEELPLALILEQVQWKIIHSFSSSDNVFISSSFLKGYFSMNIQFFQH